MERFAVYKNLAGSGYLLDVQSDILSGLNTRVVVPLMPLEMSPKPAKFLNPCFSVNEEDVVMLTQFLSAIPEKELKEPIQNLKQYHTEITTALDMLFTGF